MLICWNYLYLNQLLVRADANKRKEIIEALQHGFIMIWRHYNLHGEFDFSDDRMADSVGLASPKILAMARSKFWEVANWHQGSQALCFTKILCDISYLCFKTPYFLFENYAL